MMLPPERTEEQRDELVDRVAREIHLRGLAAPAVYFLNASRPYRPLGSNAMLFFDPTLHGLFGGEVKKMKVSSKGGHVLISKTNFVIALAPYFFPLYAILVIAVFALGNLIWNWHGYLVWFHLLLGAAYAFHVSLTIHVLQTQQSDITSQGYLFSAVVIFIGNICVLLFGIPLLTRHPELFKICGLWATETGKVFVWLHHLF